MLRGGLSSCMGEWRLSRKITLLSAAALVLFGLVLFASKLLEDSGENDVRPDDSGRSLLNGNQRHGGTSQFMPRGKKSLRPAEPSKDSASISRLRAFHEAGDFASIHQEIEVLSHEDRLTQVSEVLKEWCRTGDLELAQWSLSAAGEKDQSFALQLAAEALSNPSEVIREVAASRLEEVTGKRFDNSGEARAWLSAQRVEP